MTTSRKTLVVGLLLTAFALWPLLHFVVAKRHFVSPWRLFGWAMYCVPIYQPDVKFLAVRGDQRFAIDFPMAGEDGLAYRRFVHQRSQLGTLVSPDDLGRILFRQYPLVDHIVVRITQPVFHSDSDTIRHAYFEYSFERLETPRGPP